MPSRRGLRQLIGISLHAELITMVSFGMVRSAMNWFSFTWDGNVQEIWDLPGPEPSFSAKYHFDYWIRNVLSLVVLFRSFTTHLHLLFYIVMLYPVLTGERPGLMLPWLYLQMAKNIVTDLICTAAGVLLCSILHSCGLKALEFFIVQMVSTMPSIYLWRRLRSYYFDLYYAELDGEFLFPGAKGNQDLTLAQRRRATKSLDGTISMMSYSDNRSRVNSCLTYDEFFGPANWMVDAENNLSKSLTTLLTSESRESDDVDEDSCLKIIDDENLTPVEKTLKILGLTREEADASAPQLHKRTSTTDLGDSGTGASEASIDAGMKFSFFSVTGEAVGSCAVGIQVRLPNKSESTTSSKVYDSSEDAGTERTKKCKCCEETKCHKKDDADSGEEDAESTSQSNKTTRNPGGLSSRENTVDCCDRNRKRDGKQRDVKSVDEETDDDTMGQVDPQKNDMGSGNDSRTVSTASTYCKNDCYPGSCLRAVVERDGIAWENLKEINFVSVINKALCNEIKPFKLQRDSQSPEKSVAAVFENIFKDSEEEPEFQSERNVKEIIPEREDGTKFIHRPQESSNLKSTWFRGPTLAKFGVESDISALNSSYVFERRPISGTQSFDSTTEPREYLIRPDHDTGFDSSFESSFQGHSDAFHDTRDESNSRVHNYDGREFDRVNFTGNEVDVVRDIPESIKSNGSANRQIISGSKIDCSSLDMTEKNFSSSPISLAKKNNEVTCASQISSMTFKAAFKEETISNYTNVRDKSNSNSEAIVQSEERDNGTTPFSVAGESVTGKKSAYLISSHQNGSKDRRSLVSSSRSSRTSKTGETLEERETKEMQALKAYNENTLFKYKREMDARNRDERVENKCRDTLSKESPAGTNGNSFNQDFYVPPVPELEIPEKELILNIENAYARFTRSKPLDPVHSGAPYGNCVAKEFFDIYSCNGRLKKDSRKIKLNDKTAMRKQYSKYSKLSEGINESDATSRSCKRIEGSQKGRELGRTLAKENIRAQNMEVYFLEPLIDDKPSTSKNIPVTTIKSFSRKDGADPFPTVSSEILTPEGTRSPVVEVSNNPEEVLCRIEDSRYCSNSRKNNVPENVKETVKNIDWSFQQPISIGSYRHKEEPDNYESKGIVRADVISEGENIFQETTEDALRSIFANGENSERGFRLGESADKFYPIFDRVAVAMEEIVRAAALRGYTDEFISQPATEIELPEIEGGDLHGVVNLRSQLRRRSSSGFLRCRILAEGIRAVKNQSEHEVSLSITTSTAPNLWEKKGGAVRRETDPLDRDEAISIDDEKSSSLLSKLISCTEPGLAEVNIPVIGPEDVPEEPEDTSGDLPSPGVGHVEDYSSFLFKGTSAHKKSPVLSKCLSSEQSHQVKSKTKRIDSERVRLALQNVILQSSGQEIPDKNDSQFEFNVASYQGILDHFNAGGKGMQSIIFEFFDQIPSSETSVSHGCLPANLRGSEFVAGLQMLNNLFAIETKVGGIAKATEYREASEETPSGGSGNSPLEQNDQSEGATTQAGTSGTTNFGNATTTTLAGSHGFWRKEDREKEDDDVGRKGVVDINLNPGSGGSSSEKIDKPRDDRKRLLSNVSEAEFVSLTRSEILNRTNFRREVISSAFVQAIKQGAGSSDATKGTEAEILASNNEDMEAETESSTPNHVELDGFKSRDLTDAEPETEMSELWIADNNEQMTPRSALVCPIKEDFFTDGDNARSNTVLRDIETAERAIKRMKTIFEQFFAEGQRGQEQAGKRETSLEINSKFSSLTNLRFPVNGELEKLQNLVQTVVNYVTMTGSSSAKSVESSDEAAESNVRRKEIIAGCGNDTSNNLEEVPEILPRNTLKSDTDDCQAAEIPVSKTRSSLKNPESPVCSKNGLERFSSWDKVIPLATKRLMVKNKRKNKSKKVLAVRESPRKVAKLVKLIGKKNADFLSARSVPQRGRGLSSGYLMDSDSDGNFTVSRPLTPVSIESKSSQTFSCDDAQLDVFSNPLKAMEIFPVSGTSHSCTANPPIETCWSSSSANPVEGSKGGNQSTQNPLLDEEFHVLGAESLSTESDLKYMTSIDAAGIKNKLKDVVQQILSHQFSRVNPLTIGFRIGSKNASFTSVPDFTRIDSCADLQSNNCNPEDAIQEETQIKSDCQEKIQELLSKVNDTSIEQHNDHYRGSDSTSRNSDAVSFEVSRVSVKHVAVGTEYDIEVLKDLLDTFEEIHSVGKKMMPRQASKSCGVDAVDDDSPINGEDEREIVKSNSPFRNQALPLVQTNTSGATSPKALTLKRMADEDAAAFPFDSRSPLGVVLVKSSSAVDKMNTEIRGHGNADEKVHVLELDTTSYDSFSSLFYENTTDVSEPSCQAMSISNHTYFEDFPEQVDSSPGTSSRSIKFESKEKAHEKSSRKDISLANVNESSSSKADDKSTRDATPKKKGIPRPVKGSKEGK